MSEELVMKKFMAQMRENDLATLRMMQRSIDKIQLLQDAKEYYDSIPRWRIFKRRFARQVQWSTILMVAEMK